jgi:hypothetical protein
MRLGISLEARVDLTEMLMYVRILRNAGHVRLFSISGLTPSGWEVREEQDGRIVRTRHYGDWHRVERAELTFSLEATRLRDGGWVESI